MPVLKILSYSLTTEGTRQVLKMVQRKGEKHKFIWSKFVWANLIFLQEQ